MLLRRPITLRQKIIAVLVFKLIMIFVLKKTFKARKTQVTTPLLEKRLLDQK